MKTAELLKRDWIIWLIILVPFVFALVRWNDFPQQVPIHWNADGEVDNYAGKWAVFLSPLINIGIYLMMLMMPRIDPRKKNYEMFSGAYYWFRILITLVLAVAGMLTILVPLGVKLNVGIIITTLVTVVFLLMGNQFGRIRPNYFVGIRTPWTLNNDEVWTRTHRFTGRIWVIASLLMLPGIFLLPMKIMAVFFTAYIVVLVAVPFVYSYRLHKTLSAH